MDSPSSNPCCSGVSRTHSGKWWVWGFLVSFLNVLDVALLSTVPNSTPQTSRPVFLNWACPFWLAVQCFWEVFRRAPLLRWDRRDCSSWLAVLSRNSCRKHFEHFCSLCPLQWNCLKLCSRKLGCQVCPRARMCVWRRGSLPMVGREKLLGVCGL